MTNAPQFGRVNLVNLGFAGTKPSRTAAPVEALPKGVSVEIEVLAEV